MLLPALNFELGRDLGPVIAPANPVPAAALAAVPNGLAVAFSDLSTVAEGAIVAWEWDFGDGTYSITQNPSHVYAANGTYQASLTVTTAAGRRAKATQEVTVPAVPVLSTAIAAMAGKTLVLPPGTYALDASVTPSTTRLVMQHGTVITVPVSRTLAADIDMSQGGKIQPASGVTVTLPGNLNIPPYHHAFDLSLGGTVVGTTATGYSPSICHFADSRTATDWRQALVTAHAMLESMGPGGVLRFPARNGTYTCDFTGHSPITWSGNAIWWKGDSTAAAVLINSATDGTDLISFSSAGNSVQRCGWRNLKIVSQSTAGHVWSFAAKGIAFCRFENLWVQQLALTKAIMTTATLPTGQFEGSGGMIENQWVGGVYEHGSAAAASVPVVKAFDLRCEGNLISLQKWQDLRVHCHGSLDYFFSVDISSASNGGHSHQNEWRGINCEVVHRGFLRIAGTRGSIVRDVMFYDVHLDMTEGLVDGHSIQTATGSGGKINEQTRISDVHRGAGSLAGLADALLTPSALSQSAGTATCTVAAHGYVTGDKIYIVNALPDAYNGLKSITVVDANTFTFPIDAGTASPATLGSAARVSRVGRAVAAGNLTQAAGVATCNTVQDHGLATGMAAHIEGATPSDYNGRKVVTVIDANTFTFPIDSGVSSPATGTITATRGAMDVDWDSGEVDSIMENVQADGGSPMEADLANQPIVVIEQRDDRLLLRREHADKSLVLSQGGGGGKTADVRATEMVVDQIRARTPGGSIEVGSAVQWPSGEEIVNIHRTSATLDFGSIAAAAEAELTVTLAGIGVSDFLWTAQPSGAVEANLSWSAWISAADTIRVRMRNNNPSGGAAIDPASRTWRFAVVEMI